jgi:hypothetical protein
MQIFIIYVRSKTMLEIGYVFANLEEAEKNRQDILKGATGTCALEVLIIERTLNV